MVAMVVPSLDDCGELFSGLFMLLVLSSTALFREDSFGRGQTHKWSECEHQSDYAVIITKQDIVIACSEAHETS